MKKRTHKRARAKALSIDSSKIFIGLFLALAVLVLATACFAGEESYPVDRAADYAVNNDVSQTLVVKPGKFFFQCIDNLFGNQPA